jgi:predicted kinase
MPKLTITKGLPASGKTTWAKEQVLKSNLQTKRVNKDDLREMIDSSQWTKSNEKHIVAVRDLITQYYLSNGFKVIVDDTNLSPDHEPRLRKIAEDTGSEFQIESFLDVSLATCILRNAKRANPVPEKAIKSMYNTFIRKKGQVAQYTPPPYNEDLPTCIIVDIDGTLAHMNGRSPYDYSKVSTDIVDKEVADMVANYYYDGRDISGIPQTYVVIVSGREDGCHSQTVKWLADNNIPYDEIYMRASGDMRDDRIVKKEIYEQFIKPRFNVRFVLDDRDRVVKMWREEGLKVLQVAEGDF